MSGVTKGASITNSSKVIITTHKEYKKEQLKKEREKEQKMKEYENHWETIGEQRITTYCPCCNDPVGSYQSSSGATLQEGYVACNWLDVGTKIRINGAEYIVMDTCGTEAIDIFVDTSCCMCNDDYYTNVEIWRE